MRSKIVKSVGRVYHNIIVGSAVDIVGRMIFFFKNIRGKMDRCHQFRGILSPPLSAVAM